MYKQLNRQNKMKICLKKLLRAFVRNILDCRKIRKLS
uniref:Uncharacterized protein n=1 Tax=Podoviridae sp. ct8Lf7 TaxID=2827723 RepID=A0A8S5S0H8_9CAUD|nr:MAG TPA: hypothetical protein [Podoviridae sp. ct8Lf7]